jgi:hypothetical protein
VHSLSHSGGYTARCPHCRENSALTYPGYARKTPRAVGFVFKVALGVVIGTITIFVLAVAVSVVASTFESEPRAAWACGCGCGALILAALVIAALLSG